MRLPDYQKQVTAQTPSTSAAVQKRAVRDPGDVAGLLSNRAESGALRSLSRKEELRDAASQYRGAAIMDAVEIAAAVISFGVTAAASVGATTAGATAAGATTAGATAAGSAAQAGSAAAGTAAAENLVSAGGGALLTAPKAASISIEKMAAAQKVLDASKGKENFSALFGKPEWADAVKSVNMSAPNISYSPSNEDRSFNMSAPNLSYDLPTEKTKNFLGKAKEVFTDPNSFLGGALESAGRQAFPGVAKAWDLGAGVAKKRTQVEENNGKKYFAQAQMDLNSSISQMLATGQVETYDEKFREIKDEMFEKARSELSPGSFESFEAAALQDLNARHRQIVEQAAMATFQERVQIYEADLNLAIASGDMESVEQAISLAAYGDPSVEEDKRIKFLSPAEADNARRDAAQRIFEKKVDSDLSRLGSFGQAIYALTRTNGEGEFLYGGKQTYDYSYTDENGEAKTIQVEVGLSGEQRTAKTKEYEARQVSGDNQRKRLSELKYNEGMGMMEDFFSQKKDFYEWIKTVEPYLEGADESSLRTFYEAAVSVKDERVSRELSDSITAGAVIEIIQNGGETKDITSLITGAMKLGTMNKENGVWLWNFTKDINASVGLSKVEGRVKDAIKDKDGLVSNKMVTDIMTDIRTYQSSEAYNNDSDAERDKAIDNIINERKFAGEEESAAIALASALEKTTHIFEPESWLLGDQNKALEQAYLKGLNGGYAGLETSFAPSLSYLKTKADDYMSKNRPELSWSRTVSGVPIYADENGREYIMDMEEVGWPKKLQPIVRPLNEAKKNRAILNENRAQIGKIIFPPPVGDNMVEASAQIYLQNGYTELSDAGLEILACPSAAESKEGWRIIRAKGHDTYYKFNKDTYETVQFNSISDLNNYISRANGTYDFGGTVKFILDLDMLREASNAMRVAAQEKDNE